MILIKNGKVIAWAKKNQNLFTLNLAQPKKAMIIINKKPKTIAIISWGQQTYLVSQNKYIYFWHYCLIYVNNICIIKVFKLIDSINFNIVVKYNPVEVPVNLDNSNTSNISDHKNLASNNTIIPPKVVVHQITNINILDKLYMPYIRIKSTKIIKRDKSMTSITSKLKKVHINL